MTIEKWFNELVGIVILNCILYMESHNKCRNKKYQNFCSGKTEICILILTTVMIDVWFG